MAKTELDIIIDENGEIHMDIKGTKGKTCIEIAEEIAQILGRIKTKKPKPEYYEDEVSIKKQIDTETKN